MAEFVLVHGAWHGAWCWRDVVPLLTASGHSVTAIDLPGHGTDQTPLEQITFESYIDTIVRAMQGRSAILVGHSMGGLITTVAERLPEAVQALVYIAATVPENGRSLMDVVAGSDGAWTSQFVFSPNGLMATLASGAAEHFLYQMSPPSTARWAATQLCPEPLAPARTPISTTESRSGAVPKYYVECLQDRVVPIQLQRQVAATLKCTRICTIDCDHSPFLSRPAEFATCLNSIAAVLNKK